MLYSVTVHKAILVNKKTGETPQQDLIDKMKRQLKVWRVGMV